MLKTWAKMDVFTSFFHACSPAFPSCSCDKKPVRDTTLREVLEMMPLCPFAVEDALCVKLPSRSRREEIKIN